MTLNVGLVNYTRFRIFSNFEDKNITINIQGPTTATTKFGTKTFLTLVVITLQMFVWQYIRLKQNKLLSDNSQMVTINFCSLEMIRNQNVKLSRVDGTYDDAVADLFKKSFGLNSKKKCSIHQ